MLCSHSRLQTTTSPLPTYITDRFAGQLSTFSRFEERFRPQHAIVYVVTSDWLDSYGYEAVYSMPDESISGRYTTHGYRDASGEWLLMGTFDVTADSVHLPYYLLPSTPQPHLPRRRLTVSQTTIAAVVAHAWLLVAALA